MKCFKDYQAKGRKGDIIEWSTRLYAAYEMALARHKNLKVLQIDPYLIAGFTGRNFSSY